MNIPKTKHVDFDRFAANQQSISLRCACVRVYIFLCNCSCVGEPLSNHTKILGPDSKLQCSDGGWSAIMRVWVCACVGVCMRPHALVCARVTCVSVRVCLNAC